MKRTEYFANQSRNKLVDFDGNISYSDWKNDKEWEIVKMKKVETEIKNGELVNSTTEPIYEMRNICERFLGVDIKQLILMWIKQGRKLLTLMEISLTVIGK